MRKRAVRYRIVRHMAAVLLLSSFFLILFLSLVTQSNGGDYTAGQADGIVHEQMQQLSQGLSAEKQKLLSMHPDFPAMTGILFPVFVLFLISPVMKEKNLSGYIQNTLVSLCVRIDD